MNVHSINRALIFITLLNFTLVSCTVACGETLDERVQTLTEAIKKADVDDLTDNFAFPSGYSDKQRQVEKEKHTKALTLLFSELGKASNSSKSEFKGKIYPITLSTGHDPRWIESEANIAVETSRHIVNFEKYGDLIVELNMVKLQGECWGLFSFAVGDTDKESNKTAKLNKFGYKLIPVLFGTQG